MQVARREDARLAPLLDQFVLVRVVQMKGVDLDLFQFDYDQTWAVFFLNADRTIYGRYGTRSSDRKTADKDVSVDGFVRAMEGALEIHAGYPANKASLAGKIGPAQKTKRAEKFSALQGGRHDQPLPQGCIHCHEVWQGVRADTRPAGKGVPDEWLWVYPMPDALGLSLDRDQRATVSAVARGSAAEKAGFREKDRIVRLEGQPLVSVADVQWVLEHARTPGEVRAEVARGSETVSLTLPLAEGWRRAGDFTWRESSWPLRGGMRLDPMKPEDVRTVGGGKAIVGLEVRNAWPQGAAAKAGFRTGDQFVSVDGTTTPMTETEFIAFLFQKKKAGDSVEIVVARSGGKRVKLKLPVPG